jgi:hypothetical protein
MIREELARGALKPLPLREGAERHATLYLVFPDRDYAGPGAQRLAELLREGAEGMERGVRNPDHQCEAQSRATVFGQLAVAIAVDAAVEPAMK